MAPHLFILADFFFTQKSRISQKSLIGDLVYSEFTLIGLSLATLYTVNLLGTDFESLCVRPCTAADMPKCVAGGRPEHRGSPAGLS